MDYRAFIFVVHEQHGMLLLHCTRKPKKGHHFQLPGGHVDDYEFDYARDKYGTGLSTDTNEVLIEACKLGAARELFEETGMDVRSQLDRLEPAALKEKAHRDELTCMLKNKCYFYLSVDDDDFPKGDGPEFMPPMDDQGSHLRLKLSHEHAGYKFVGDPRQSIHLLAAHSGGAGSRALQMSMEKAERQNVEDQEGTNVLSNEVEEKLVVGQDSLLIPPMSKRTKGFSLFSCCRLFC